MKKGSGITWSSRPEVFSKKVFLNISQNPQENTCTRGPILIKLQAWACNLSKKNALAQVFFCEFCEIFKNLFFTEPRATASGFFYSFHCFAAWWTNRNQSFSIFGHVLSRHSNVMNIMNLNDLVLAAWKHTFLGDITWNLALFCRLISISICTYWISMLHCPATIHLWNT